MFIILLKGFSSCWILNYEIFVCFSMLSHVDFEKIVKIVENHILLRYIWYTCIVQEYSKGYFIIPRRLNHSTTCIKLILIEWLVQNYHQVLKCIVMLHYEFNAPWILTMLNCYPLFRTRKLQTKPDIDYSIVSCIKCQYLPIFVQWLNTYS